MWIEKCVYTKIAISRTIPYLKRSTFPLLFLLREDCPIQITPWSLYINVTCQSSVVNI